MPDFNIKNISNTAIDSKLSENIKERIEKWQKKNDFPIFVLIEKSDSEKIYDFVFEKKSWEILEKGVEHNLLKGSIDNEFKNWKKLEGKIQFVFYVGFSKNDFEKLISKEQSLSETDEIKLNISPIEPKYSLSQVVLCEETNNEIKDVISLLKNMNKIYYEWGFAEIDPVPRSIVNFWGPPGTGKTMTVHAIAKEMNKKILVLNYADIESKYVGEAPKNLVAAFEKAEKEDAVIFFDEADSFLGKRITNVDSGSEQAINSLRSQMLMKLEEFKGIVFFATNLHENYDKAFESRILKHIEFKLPNLEARKFIIKGKLPKKAPYSSDVINESGEIKDELLAQLSEIIDGFSGREIKNCVLESLVKAAKENALEVTSSMLIDTFKSKKEEVESLKQKEKERKDKLSNVVKKNIDDKKYNIKKIDSDGVETVISAEEIEQTNIEKGE